MNDPKQDRRDAKRNKKRRAMKVNSRGLISTILPVIAKKGREAAEKLG